MKRLREWTIDQRWRNFGVVNRGACAAGPAEHSADSEADLCGSPHPRPVRLNDVQHLPKITSHPRAICSLSLRATSSHEFALAASFSYSIPLERRRFTQLRMTLDRGQGSAITGA